MARKKAKRQHHNKGMLDSVLGLFKRRVSRKNAQSLPMTTIVLIIIAMIVLAVVVIFFFGQFGASQNTVNQQVAIGSNMTANLKCDTWSSGFTTISADDCKKCDSSYWTKAIDNKAKIKIGDAAPCVVNSASESACAC